MELYRFSPLCALDRDKFTFYQKWHAGRWRYGSSNPGTTWKWVFRRTLDHFGDGRWGRVGNLVSTDRTAWMGPGSVLYAAKKQKVSFPSIF